MQQTLSQEGDCCPWAKQPYPSPKLFLWGRPQSKSPLPRPARGPSKHQRWAESWRCAQDWHPQHKVQLAVLHLAPCEADCQLLCLAPAASGSSCCCPGEIQKSLLLVPPGEWPPWHRRGAHSKGPCRQHEHPAGTGTAKADRMIFPGLIQEEVLSCSKLPVPPIDHC